MLNMNAIRRAPPAFEHWVLGIASGRIAVGRDAGEEFDAGFEPAVDAAVVAVHPDHTGVQHVAAIGERLPLAVEPDVNAQRVAHLDGGESRKFDAKPGSADVFGLPAEV